MKLARVVHAALAATLVLPLALTGAPAPALACGSAVYFSSIPEAPLRQTPNKGLLIAQAEAELSEGHHQKAAAKALEAFPALKIVKPGAVPLADRALRLLALAAVRADGGLGVGGFAGKTASEREANLAWSVDVLRGLNARRVNDPSYQTDLGEALARLPAQRDEAAQILGGLAERDLLTSAEGYAALARLRSDNATRLALATRCRTMTKTPAICRVPLIAETAGEG